MLAHELLTPFDPEHLMCCNSILIVDSDARCVSLVKRALSAVGYRCEVANCCKTASELVRHGDFGIALVADQISGCNGLDWLARLRRLDSELIGLVLTDQPDLPTVVSALDYGAFQVVPRPVDERSLKELMRSIEDCRKYGSQVSALRPRPTVAVN